MGWNNTPPLQKQILKLLSTEGALTKNEIAEKLGKSYKNVVFSLDSLESKKLVEVVGEKSYRNQTFKTYWLTWYGILEACAIGCRPETLKSHVLRYVKGELTPQALTAINTLFKFLEALTPAQIRQFANCLDFSTSPPKVKQIPLNIINPHEGRKMLKIIAENEPYKSLVKTALKQALDSLEEASTP